MSVLFLTDTPKYLFTPQALAVVFAMLTSYLLSRTLVPICIDCFRSRKNDAQRFGENHSEKQQASEQHQEAAAENKASPKRKPGFFKPLSCWLRARASRDFTRRLSRALLHVADRTSRWATFVVVGAVVALVMGAVLFNFVGQDYFPQIDAGSS